GHILWICPMPLTSAELAQAGKRLAQRIPPAALAEFESIKDRIRKTGRDKGEDPFRCIAPWYFARREIPEGFDTGFRVLVADRLSHLFSAYDFSETVRTPGGKSTVILGEDDYIRVGDLTALCSAAKRVCVIPGAAHYPFAENPQAFEAAVLGTIDG
ncbi:MAG: alpha/beta hydrolase, partial [Pseudomonadota bacterium]|nr:alpha/beta hydrolase [Pseudomonadota bacterium]